MDGTGGGGSMKIIVEIERLVLDGLPVNNRDSHVVRAAVEKELARMLAVDGISRESVSGGSVPRLRAPGVRIGGTPAAMGNSIASAVHRSLAPAGGPQHE